MSAKEPTDRLYTGAMLREIIEREAISRLLDEGTATQEQIAEKLGVSRQTVGRVKSRKQRGEAMYDRRHDNPGRKSRVSNESISYSLQYLERFPKAKLTHVLRSMQEGDHGYDGPVPNYQQLRYTLEKLPADMLPMLRDGTKDYIQETALTARREEDCINRVWQIDALDMPLHVIDVTTGQLIKPWMVGAIDCYSRVVPLAVVHREHPKSVDVLKAILQAILPNGQTFAYGQPTILVPDNHSIFTSDEFMDAAVRAGIRIEFPPPDAPQAKGKVERFFRTFAEQCCANLIGFSDQSSGLAKAKQGAIPFPCLQPLVDQYLQRYHSTTHSAINTAPWIKWHEGLANAEGLAEKIVELLNSEAIAPDTLKCAYPDSNRFFLFIAGSENQFLVNRIEDNPDLLAFLDLKNLGAPLREPVERCVEKILYERLYGRLNGSGVCVLDGHEATYINQDLKSSRDSSEGLLSQRNIQN